MMKAKTTALRAFLGSANIPLTSYELCGQLERRHPNDNLLYANMGFWHVVVGIVFNNKLPGAGTTGEKDATDDAMGCLTQRTDQTVLVEDVAAAVTLSASHFPLRSRKNGLFTD